MIRMQTVAGAIKRFADITVTDLHQMKQREINNILKTLPYVMQQVKNENTRRNGAAQLGSEVYP